MQPATKHVKFGEEEEEDPQEIVNLQEEILGEKGYMDEQLYATSSVQRLAEKFQSGELPLPSTWQRINITPEAISSPEVSQVCEKLNLCLNLREKWLFVPNDPPEGLGPNSRPFDPFHCDLKKV